MIRARVKGPQHMDSCPFCGCFCVLSLPLPCLRTCFIIMKRMGAPFSTEVGSQHRLGRVQCHLQVPPRPPGILSWYTQVSNSLNIHNMALPQQNPWGQFHSAAPCPPLNQPACLEVPPPYLCCRLSFILNFLNL